MTRRAPYEGFVGEAARRAGDEDGLVWGVKNGLPGGVQKSAVAGQAGGRVWLVGVRGRRGLPRSTLGLGLTGLGCTRVGLSMEVVPCGCFWMGGVRVGKVFRTNWGFGVMGCRTGASWPSRCGDPLLGKRSSALWGRL